MLVAAGLLAASRAPAPRRPSRSRADAPQRRARGALGAGARRRPARRLGRARRRRCRRDALRLRGARALPSAREVWSIATAPPPATVAAVAATAVTFTVDPAAPSISACARISEAAARSLSHAATDS